MILLYDIVVIGAGVTGCSIARELSKYENLRILVIEKSDDVAAGASKANSGIVHGGYDELHGTLKSKLAHKGNQMFKRLNDELQFGFRVTGSLVLAFSEAEVPELERLIANGIKNGVSDLKIINREEILELEPHINPHVYKALHCPHTGLTSPYEYTIALAENAILNGVEFRLNHEVTDIQLAGDSSAENNKGRFIIRAGLDEIIHTRFIVNAAGIYADKVASLVGAADFKILPRKGEYIILEKSQSMLAKHVLFPVPSPTRGKGILVSPTYHGNLLLGPTSRDISNLLQPSPTQAEILREIISSARMSVPGFDVSKTITSYSGLRAKSDRKDFIIEESQYVRGFINCAGIDSPGLTSSPAVALLVKDLIEKMDVRLIQKQNFNPNRNGIIVKKGDRFMGEIDHPTNPYLNIICRCERVTEAEIVDAIHRPLGAHSIDAVKKRTRAGMGQCQGSFCEGRVIDIISRETNIPKDKVKKRGVGSSILPHQRITSEDRQYLEKIAKL